MESKFVSRALEENLAQTKQEAAELPEEHSWFVSLSSGYWGIHKRTKELFIEYNHPHPDNSYIIENLHTISLNDLWLYSSVADGERALGFLVSIFEELMDQNLNFQQREQLIKSVFKFIDRLINEEHYPPSAVYRCLQIIEKGIDQHEIIYLRNAGYFKKYLYRAAVVPEFTETVCRLTKDVLRRSLSYWTRTSNIEDWFESKAELFQPIYHEKIKLVGQDFYSRLEAQIDNSEEWEDIESNLFFNDIANHFRQFSEEFNLSVEKTYYLVYLLHLPGMIQLKKHLLYDLNRLIRTALKELKGEEIIHYTGMLFNLFAELKEQQTDTVLDCLFTLGKEIVSIDSPKITAHFIQKLLEFGFVYPGEIEITSDWEIKANSNHVKNIRIWLELIGTSPYKFKKLLSALVVNLKLGGIFIADTDLFQRDVTKLLNADIGSVYKQVKQLARVFPVYFNEIGAEGKLREVSTIIDEVAGRQDYMIHFVRKQVHTESNNTHIILVNRVAEYWLNGNPEILKPILPNDVYNALDQQSDYFTGVNFLMKAICQHYEVDHEEFLKLPEEDIISFFADYPSKYDRDKKRINYLYQLNSLLLEKYSFETRDVTGILQRSRFFTNKDIEKLEVLLQQNQDRKALELVYGFMAILKEVIISSEPTEAIETIYYKRHIAVGIPSMYGQYKEPKFEALGLMYRLEQVASKLMEKILEEIKLEYISAKTLKEIYETLELFKTGLELDGVVNQNFNSTLEMFRYSLTSTSVTLSQYMNIFRFMAQHIKELINEYFIRVYDETINIVIPQIFDSEPETVARESEKFYRDILSSAFLVQELDQFISESLNMINNMLENYSEAHIYNMMTYNPDLAASPLNRETQMIDNQVFLGAKAYYLKKLINYGLPIPPGFVLTTEVYRHRETIFEHPYMSLELDKIITKYLTDLEKLTNLKFGSPKKPILLSVRSGTAISMPGAMSTFLNVGMNDQIADALDKSRETAWMGWDSYRRFIQSWGMSHGIERDCFDEVMSSLKNKYGVDRKSNFTSIQMKELALEYKKALNDHGVFIIENPFEQLKQAINNIFKSWSSPRTIAYRKHLQIADEWGTAVLVQKMVMGNRSKRSGSGVAFTHNPKLKKPGINLYGDFTLCSQGEDIVAGLVYPLPISESQRTENFVESEISLETSFPGIFNRLREIAVQLIEEYGFNNQEIEFTFESEDPTDLYILQIREQNIIQQEKMMIFSTPVEEMQFIGRGIGVGGGCLSGMVSFDMEDLQINRKQWPEEKHILIRPDTVPDDIQMIFICDGLVTSRGGVTSHAAVAAEKLGKVCVVNCKELMVDDRLKQCLINGFKIRARDKISIDGRVGSIYAGSYPVQYIK
ncbi:MAG: PEP/pyruvate-binding domain-containing protein [Bacillota bacterium]|nr:PEP/pyruvate-binding domain-containing protein [Bacillota bacterium]